MNKRVAGWVIGLLSAYLALASNAMAADAVGKVGHMSGTLVAQRTDGSVKVLGSQSEVMAGDLLITNKDGYAQIVLNDGGQMTLRPNSNLKIEAYRFNKEDPKSDNALFSLLKGGFRAVTGLIGKRGDPDAYKVRAASATIGIRGTDYTSRLCATADCKDNSKAVAQTTVAAGRVMLVQGELSAQGVGGKTRVLSLGGQVFEGDKIITGKGAHAVVNFRDGSRITLQAETQFLVEKYKYTHEGGEENAVLRLLKGGVRVVTGLIGRFTHDNYQFKVANSTIGIRGTGFDSWCNGPCAENALDPGATPENPMQGGGVYVWQGAVVLNTPHGSVDVPTLQAAIIGRANTPPVRVENIPDPIRNNPAPLPDSVPANPALDVTEKDPALFVTVHDGQVIMAQGGSKLDLKTGETGLANQQQLTRLPAPPAFMKIEPVQIRSTNPNLEKGGCVVK